MSGFEMTENLTLLLNDWNKDAKASRVSEQLFEAIYRELIAIARPLIGREQRPNAGHL